LTRKDEPNLIESDEKEEEELNQNQKQEEESITKKAD